MDGASVEPQTASEFHRRVEQAEVAGVMNELQACGRLAGVLFVVGAISATVSALSFEGAPPPAIYAVVVAAILCGAACFAIPWQRLPRGAFHFVAALGTGTVGLAVAAGGPQLAFYYVFVAVFTSYVFAERPAVTGQLALVVLALAAPVAYEGTSREWLTAVLVTLPNVVVVAVVVTHLRERLRAEHRAYRRFAEQAFDVALRLRTEATVEDRLVSARSRAAARWHTRAS
jgi:hypothetical protein